MTLLFLLFLFFHLEIVIKRHKKKICRYTFKIHHFYFILLKYKVYGDMYILFLIFSFFFWDNNQI
jgi:hypothetical protein